MLKFYGYANCSTCRKARAWLTDQGIEFTDIDITTHPPSKPTLKAILRSGEYESRHLLNTSGQVYRQMNLKDKIKTMSRDDLLDLLASNGKLIKRPIITDGQRHTVGLDLDRLTDMWGKR